MSYRVMTQKPGPGPPLGRILEFLAPASREQLEALGSRDAMRRAALRARPFYGSVVVRTRYAEDALAAAVGRGVRQYVILGAGLDRFGRQQMKSAPLISILGRRDGDGRPCRRAII